MHPKDCLSFKFRKTERVLARQYTQVMAEASLQSTQFTLLTHIKNYGPISIKDLALNVGTDSSTMSRNLKILINEGWVKFMTNQDDARTHLVQISLKGSKKYEEARLLWEKQ
jgi:DNA-binding MarR family transcriptional regulator